MNTNVGIENDQIRIRDFKRADHIGKKLNDELAGKKKCCGKSVQWLRENIESPENTVDDRLFSDEESRRDAWNRLKPFYDEVINSEEENIIIVSHGDLLSIWNAMYIGLPLESFYDVDIHGPAGGVSHMIIGEDGKHRVRHINDMSYITGGINQ